MIEKAIRSRMISDAGVSALLSTRVYCGQAPQALPGADPYPYSIITLISESPSHTLDGYSGHTECRIQIDAWARTYASAKAIQEALRNCWDGYRGTITVDSTDFEFGHCFMTTVADALDDGDPGSEDALKRVIVDLMIGTRQSAPTLA